MSAPATARRQAVIVGNLTIDDIVHPDGATSMAQPGGNAIFATLGARLWCDDVGVVMRYGPDLPAQVLATLAELGVALAGARAVSAPTPRAWLLYEDDGSRRFIPRSPEDRNGDAVVRPDDVPDEWLLTEPAPVVHIAPMRLSAAAALVGGVRTKAPAATIIFDPHEDAVVDRDGTLAVARRVDVFAPSRDELRELVGYDDPARALDELRAAGVATVIAKLGAQGALIGDAAGQRVVPARATTVADPTGAGDTFCGAMAGAIAAGFSVRDAAVRASVTASWSIETSGSLALASMDIDSARLRLSTRQ